MRNAQIMKYYNDHGNCYISVGTTYTADGELRLILAPQFEIDNGDLVYDTSGEIFEIVHSEVYGIEDGSLKMLEDFNCGNPCIIAIGRIVKREF